MSVLVPIPDKRPIFRVSDDAVKSIGMMRYERSNDDVLLRDIWRALMSGDDSGG